MKTIKIMLWVLLAGAGLLAACGKTSYKKTPGGMPYQLFRRSMTACCTVPKKGCLFIS